MIYSPSDGFGDIGMNLVYVREEGQTESAKKKNESRVYFENEK